MDNNDIFPPVSDELVKKIEEVFPIRDDFGPNVPQNSLVFYHGQRSVVRFLLNQNQLQNENLLTKE